MEIEWTETALDDMGGLDQGIARRVKQSIERFAETGAGNVKDSRESTRLSTASASETFGSASTWMARSFAFCGSATAEKLTAKKSVASVEP